MTDEQRHRDKMRNRKRVQDAEVASKTVERGVLAVHTGTGKGKSTASFGLALRMLGHGKRVVVIQFIKGAWETGERLALSRFDDLLEWHTMGEGFTWDTQDRARDISAAERAWQVAQEALRRSDVALVILDELNIALRYDYLSLEMVLSDLTLRPDHQHVVVTGRNAKPALIDRADLVTDMGAVKHHFASGFKAQAGFEF